MHSEHLAATRRVRLRGGLVSFDWQRLAASAVLASATLCLALAGCGGGGLDTVAVNGTVTYDGKPLENGIVRFVPVDPAGMLATGTLKSGGAFTLATRGTEGVLKGDYKVTVESFLIDESVPEKDRELGIGGKKSAIPEFYSDPEKSGLTETISGSRSISIDLQSK